MENTPNTITQVGDNFLMEGEKCQKRAAKRKNQATIKSSLFFASKGVSKMQDDEMKKLEDQVRRELGIENVGPNMTAHEAGMIGGYMVKKLIERGEKSEKGGGMGMGEEEM